MGRIEAQSIRAWTRAVREAFPCTSQEESVEFVRGLPGAGSSPPKPEIAVEGHWFCLRSYRDTMTDERCLQVFFGSPDSGEDYVGYDRLDPAWVDPDGRGTDSWELTRAYVKPKYRGRNYCPFLVELVLDLARAGGARFVYAYPRHVAMLVTLLDYGFETVDGRIDGTLLRVREDGRRWYGLEPSQRRLYYAEELRPFVGETSSFLMRRRVRGSRLWDALTRDI